MSGRDEQLIPAFCIIVRELFDLEEEQIIRHSGTPKRELSFDTIEIGQSIIHSDIKTKISERFQALFSHPAPDFEVRIFENAVGVFREFLIDREPIRRHVFLEITASSTEIEQLSELVADAVNRLRRG